MNIKQLKTKIENLPDDMSIGVSVKQEVGDSPDAVMFIADEGKVSCGEYDDMFWVDGVFIAKDKNANHRKSN